MNKHLMEALERREGGMSNAAKAFGVSCRQWYNWKHLPTKKDWLKLGVEAKLRLLLSDPPTGTGACRKSSDPEPRPEG